MIRLPDREQRQEIRIRVREAPVRGVGLLLLIERSLPRVLDAERRRDDEHLAQGLLAVRLQNHPAHRRVHGQLRQLTAGLGQSAGLVDRAEFVQQRVARPDAFGRRCVEEGKFLDVTEPESLHAQDHVRQVAALDFRLGETRPVKKILLQKKADAHPIAHAAAAALALVGAALRDRFNRQPARAALRRVAADARQARVDHEANARNGERRLGNVGREHDFPVAGRREDPLLLCIRQPAEQRHDLELAEPATLQLVAGFADVAFGGEKYQQVALRALE